MSITNTKTDLTDDLKFLIACCKTELNEDDIHFIRSYLNPPASSSQSDTETSFLISHFSFLISMATRHGVLPLVYKTIKNLHTESQSDSSSSSRNTSHVARSTLLSELKPLYMSTVQRNMLMTSELIKIMRLLKENSIEALAFKGPALSQMAYGDITLRQYSDLDILVKKEDIYKAGKILEKNFYMASGSIEFLNDPVWVADAKDMTFFCQKKGVAVEMHWKFFKNRYANSDHKIDFWLEPNEVKINSTTIKTLQTDLLLVYLCIHGSMHVWERIEWINDIHLLISTQDIDWEKALMFSEEFQSKTMFLLGLSIAYDLFATKLPEDIMKLIGQKKIIKLKEFTLKSLQIQDKEYGSLPGLLRRAKFHANMQDSYVNKVKYWQHTLFHRTIASQEENVKKHSTLASFTRPFLLIKRYLFNLKDS